MDSWVLIILGAIVGGAAVLAQQFEKRRVSLKRARFTDRQALPLDVIYTQHYLTAGLPREAVLHQWRRVAAILKLDEAKLRPSDRFDVELAPADGAIAIDELDELTHYYKDEWRKHGGIGEPPKIATLDELIRSVASRSTDGAR